jgi:hypothetical protein
VSRVRLAAVVLAARGGERLAHALAQATWADERLVLDPTGVVERAALPRDVAAVASAAELATAPTAEWLVLVRDNEVVDAAALADARATLAAAPPRVVFTVPVLPRTIGLTLAPRRRGPRVARRGTPLDIAPGTTVGFSTAGARVLPLAVTVVQDRGESLTEALETLGADATVDAAIADQVGVSPLVVPVAWRALGALGGTLAARADGVRLGHGRWVLAVLDAYRVLATSAKLWERRRDRVVELA